MSSLRPFYVDSDALAALYSVSALSEGARGRRLREARARPVDLILIDGTSGDIGDGDGLIGGSGDGGDGGGSGGGGGDGGVCGGGGGGDDGRDRECKL